MAANEKLIKFSSRISLCQWAKLKQHVSRQTGSKRQNTTTTGDGKLFSLRYYKMNIFVSFSWCLKVEDLSCNFWVRRYIFSICCFWNDEKEENVCCKWKLLKTNVGCNFYQRTRRLAASSCFEVNICHVAFTNFSAVPTFDLSSSCPRVICR